MLSALWDAEKVENLAAAMAALMVVWTVAWKVVSTADWRADTYGMADP